MSAEHFLNRMRRLKEEEVRRRMTVLPLETLRQAASRARPAPDFAGALRRRGEPVRVIAEVKRASPSAGPIRGGEPVDLARRMAAGGAAAISVLTDGHHFGGSLEDLQKVTASLPLPVLRKDFILHEYQLLEARAAGAAACLLIAAFLGERDFRRLLGLARELGLGVLAEVHDERELEQVLEAGAGVVGVNNRDLTTLRVNLDRALELAAGFPEGPVRVAESGYRDRAEVAAAEQAGYDAVLVGEAIMRADDPAGVVRLLRGTEK